MTQSPTDRVDREQIPDRKMQADPKNQRDNADLGELLGEINIEKEAGREAADSDAGQQWRLPATGYRALAETPTEE